MFVLPVKLHAIPVQVPSNFKSQVHIWDLLEVTYEVGTWSVHCRLIAAMLPTGLSATKLSRKNSLCPKDFRVDAVAEAKVFLIS